MAKKGASREGKDRLLRELEDCRRFAMNQLADEAEEHGEQQEADGWRWLAEHGRWPERSARGKRRWRLLGYREDMPEYGNRSSLESHRIPDGASSLLRPSSDDSPSRLMCRAAVAVGGWLAQKKEERRER